MIEGLVKYLYINKRNELIVMFREPIKLNLKVSQIALELGRSKIIGCLRLYNSCINYIKLVDWQIINYEKGVVNRERG